MDNKGMDFGQFGDHVEQTQEQMMLTVMQEMQENIRILAANQEMLDNRTATLREALLELAEAHEIAVDNLLELTIEVGLRCPKKKDKKKKKEK